MSLSNVARTLVRITRGEPTKHVCDYHVACVRISTIPRTRLVSSILANFVSSVASHGTSLSSPVRVGTQVLLRIA